ncbi:FAD-dependent pyridine nucleotide-disulfide oxidoreductase [Thiomonas arsenitoxydans]|jgi:sulfide:quinone oxidoreductase|uniref:FAD-dependent pyridine nucleotide-disulfide oxidoreductase n=1 Tax=Thiomonas arsenitoxydans (strain DSM 22701 / CIP 110005 / 3As) TaxID=426114 RepID=A0ABM9T429_THIA3|nr:MULTISPECIES: FAD-dependent oxidoreductase [Thiomonas]CQR43012.1 FAD-dependent pyridine nucleotide-disulfide oxidoreductase [Thiomonas sp. CB3]CDW93642.1 FAD-dependent pyridine nucleotide-disulfide oxidoreductase [Thiomonas sp. CB2]CQR31692.1 FAD-dependent pyridine nucleotide-disulfide oxidoreductase [Thiomonas arsenitoxydans]CQR36776.1 FAD-dependent pyridine nucleotide-disulfide oxidoreductase [Thiomonas arsenitoxydans]VDY04932.1 FAD-dependent pyridine nucleotide-disulfide oxidoreductase [
MTTSKSHVVILGGNFAGLASAQKIREYAGDSVDITLIDRKDYLLFVPNVPTDVMENRDPAKRQRLQLRPALASDDIAFVQGIVKRVDIDRRSVDFLPFERPGAECEVLHYDYLVIALGAHLAYDRIPGFAEHGHTVSDLFHGERLRQYLHEGGYQGGPIVIGSAHFHQGNGAEGLAPYPGGSIPYAHAACEGPIMELTTALASWLTTSRKGKPDKITVFTPEEELIAADAGENNVRHFLKLIDGMGIHYRKNMPDIARLTAEGVEFQGGETIEAELKMILPDWVAHECLRDLPICDSMGFIKTNLLMRNPEHPEIFAAGDCAAVTMPKIGGIGHQEAEIVGRQIALDMGRMDAEEANQPLQPVTFCIGDMGESKAFYVRANTWFGGQDEVLKMGRIPYRLKMRYRDLFFLTNGKIPGFGLELAQFTAEKVF